MLRLPTIPAAGLALGASLFALSGCSAPAGADFEVWAADQNLNALYVLDAEGAVLRTLDGAALGGAERPHMLWGVRGDPYIYSANTASNSVTVLDREGAVVAVVLDVGKAPHAAQPNPRRPDSVYVFNIAPQAMGENSVPDRGESITELVRGDGPEGPTWEKGRHLDLAADPVLQGERFPSRRPVCGGFSQDGRLMLVTLFDGGLAAVDLDAWRVTAAWGPDEVARHGCGFAASEDGGELYVTAGDLESSWLYVFDVSGTLPRLVRSHDLSAVGQDAHGVYVDPERRELWVVHRVSSNITIHPLATIADADHGWEEIAFVGRTPDLVAFSPDASLAFVTLRGPEPAPTIPHATVGETPGVSIVDVAERELVGVVALGDAERSDFHGVFVPQVGAP